MTLKRRLERLEQVAPPQPTGVPHELPLRALGVLWEELEHRAFKLDPPWQDVPAEVADKLLAAPDCDPDIRARVLAWRERRDP